jgi:hypothetical protein
MTTNRTPDKGALATVLQFVFLFGLTPVAQGQTAEPNPAAGENLSGGAATGGSDWLPDPPYRRGVAAGNRR